jgi:hypothetical protein
MKGVIGFGLGELLVLVVVGIVSSVWMRYVLVLMDRKTRNRIID